MPTFSLSRVHVQHQSAPEHPSLELRIVAVNSMYCSDTGVSLECGRTRGRVEPGMQEGG